MPAGIFIQNLIQMIYQYVYRYVEIFFSILVSNEFINYFDIFFYLDENEKTFVSVKNYLHSYIHYALDYPSYN